MGKYGIFLLALLFIFTAGCRSRQKDKEAVVKINNYEITKQEFEQEFRSSSFARMPNVDSREDFLNSLIDQKLILQDAQAKGLDKKSVFLKSVERFWENSMLKIALDKKSKEIAGTVFVDDKIAAEAYDKMLKEGKTDKSYEEMQSQIKWDICRLKSSQMLDQWVEGLREDAKIEIDYKLLEELQIKDAGR